jgi:hypothetical protein
VRGGEPPFTEFSCWVVEARERILVLFVHRGDFHCLGLGQVHRVDDRLKRIPKLLGTDTGVCKVGGYLEIVCWV